MTEVTRIVKALRESLPARHLRLLRARAEREKNVWNGAMEKVQCLSEDSVDPTTGSSFGEKSRTL